MNREFQAYVYAVTNGDCAKARATSPLRQRVVRVLETLGEVLEEMGPYYCELRPMRRVRDSIAQCCSQKEVIGFHGLA